MNGVHIHLLLNHVPILGSLFALTLLAFGYGLRKDLLSKAGLITIIVSALISIPAFITGEDAEHAVEDMIGVSQSSIETHEEQAEVAYWSILFTGAIALGTFLSSLKKDSVGRPLLLVNAVLILLVFILMARTGSTGGNIRHPEIHSSTAPAVQEHDED